MVPLPDGWEPRKYRRAARSSAVGKSPGKPVSNLTGSRCQTCLCVCGEEGPGSLTLTLECFVRLETRLRDACLHLKKEAWDGGSSPRLQSLGKF